MSKTHIEDQRNLELCYKALEKIGKSKVKLLPALQLIQSKLGYVPPPAIEVVANHFEVPPIDVYEIVTFYDQFRLNPPGKRQIKVCMGTACHMKGGKNIVDSWERNLQIKTGETTGDREFSLERIACVGCCTLAPVITINDEVHGKITPTRVEGILLSFKLSDSSERQEN